MTNVSRIEPVDLTPFELSRFEWNGRTILADPPVEFHPKLDEETSQLYIVENEELDLNVFADTRQDLINEIVEHIFFVWDAYAKEAPEKMTKSAQELGVVYNTRFREMPGADL